MKVVIMAGGKGTRISTVASNIPKPMIKIEGKPVLEHEIECLRNQGFKDIIITVGYLGHVIIDYFGDGSGYSPVTGEPFCVNIEYYYETVPLGSCGALFKLRDKLTEDFLLLNSDSIFNIDFQRFLEFHKFHGGLATIFTHPNDHPYDSGLIIVNEDNSVEKWLTKEDERPTFYKNCVNAGVHILSPECLKKDLLCEKVDLDRNILKPLAGKRKLFAYNSPEYIKDMGTKIRYEEVCKDFKSGVIKESSLKKEQKAIFLDRDGTINKYIGFLKNIDDFELLPNVTKAIRRINNSGYLVIVVSNQPVIARGDLSIMKLKEIHNKMETLLGLEGAYLDGIYFCPHHPDKGYLNEISELKINCNCRKPKPGMLIKASKDFNINLEKSWMVGDSKIDILAGISASCRTALISKEGKDYGQSITSSSLYDFVETLLV